MSFPTLYLRRKLEDYPAGSQKTPRRALLGFAFGLKNNLRVIANLIAYVTHLGMWYYRWAFNSLPASDSGVFSSHSCGPCKNSHRVPLSIHLLTYASTWILSLHKPALEARQFAQSYTARRSGRQARPGLDWGSALSPLLPRQLRPQPPALSLRILALTSFLTLTEYASPLSLSEKGGTLSNSGY